MINKENQTRLTKVAGNNKIFVSFDTTTILIIQN